MPLIDLGACLPSASEMMARSLNVEESGTKANLPDARGAGLLSATASNTCEISSFSEIGTSSAKANLKEREKEKGSFGAPKGKEKTEITTWDLPVRP